MDRKYPTAAPSARLAELVRFLHPTQVYSNSDSAAMVRQASSLQAGGGRPTQLQADVHVYVGDREITDIVRTEISVHDADLASVLTYGRNA
ncbi:hypothetical protein ACFXGT_29115 [Streptomyces sp. NPDC059352]|uniref:hypothetical protein n=1 Tax=Streptomyces sp. NPDC059352 TaxID=3346810 RepID=UPI003679470F